MSLRRVVALTCRQVKEQLWEEVSSDGFSFIEP